MAIVSVYLLYVLVNPEKF
ncbi:potassium-transporting ATPase subunit F [Planococcus maritimus]